MSAFGCKACEIDWPEGKSVKGCCPICGGTLIFKQSGEPDPGWESKLERAMRAPEDSKIFDWRLGQLMKAGFAPLQAIQMAESRHVDLEEARTLVQKAGPDLAYEILA